MVNLSEDSMLSTSVVDRAMGSVAPSEHGGGGSIHNVMLDKGKNPKERWGFRLTGGTDRGAPFQLSQVGE